MAHTWRTRIDPFEAVWVEVETLLEHKTPGCRPKPCSRNSGGVTQPASEPGNCALCSDDAATGGRCVARTATTLYMYVNDDGRVKQPGQKLLDALGDT